MYDPKLGNEQPILKPKFRQLFFFPLRFVIKKVMGA